MKARQVLGTAVLAVLLISAVSGLSGLMERKDGKQKYQSFYEEKNDFDVLFLGTSHVLNGILPLELWNDKGIVSYNMGTEMAPLSETYWILENALLKTTPKLVVIDGYMLSWNNKFQDEVYVHRLFDPFPFSLTKAEGVFDVLSLSPWKIKDWIRALPFIWNLPLYHQRWDELGQSDFALNINTEKGAERKIEVTASHEEIEGPTDSETQSVGAEYLNKIIAECRNRGIEVLLVYLPTFKEQDEYLESHMMENIAEKNGVPCVNLLTCDFVYSKTDYFDYWGHLNPAGAKKVTRYLGDYIVENFDIPDHRGDEAYYDWYDDYDRYVDQEVIELKQIYRQLSVYLMMLSAENYDVVVEIGDLKMWNNEMFRKQIQEMGVDLNSVTENTDLIVLSDGGWDVTVCDYFNDQQQLGTDPVPTVLGDVKKEWTDDGQIVLKLNDTILYSIKNWSEISACPVKIAVMNRTTKELIDTAFFDVETEYDPARLNTRKIYR